MHDAIGAGAAFAVGAAAIAARSGRERAAGFFTDALERVGAGLRQGHIAGLRRAAERQCAGQDEHGDRVSHWQSPFGSAAPNDDYGTESGGGNPCGHVELDA